MQNINFPYSAAKAYSESSTPFLSQEITYDRSINQTSRQDVTKGIEREFAEKKRTFQFIASAIRRLLAFTFLLVIRRAWR